MQKKCFVTGASSQIGSWLVPKLRESGWELHLITRGKSLPPDGQGQCEWHTVDLDGPSGRLPRTNSTVLFHTAGIWLLPRWLEAFAEQGVSRVIAFSSTSRYTKVRSDNGYELEVVRKLTEAEQAVIENCGRLGIAWTILRPTMIYGGKNGDRNVTDIANLIRRLGFFPVLGRGDGLRQPVHAEDLATACIQACDAATTFDRSYNLGGGEQLSYLQMVERIFLALHRRPMFVHTPLWCFALAVRIARLHPRFRHLTTAMAERMQQDMAFPFEEASSDFGYSPRPFSPQFAESTGRL